jgi:hypothetical protein
VNVMVDAALGWVWVCVGRTLDFSKVSLLPDPIVDYTWPTAKQHQGAPIASRTAPKGHHSLPRQGSNAVGIAYLVLRTLCVLGEWVCVWGGGGGMRA